MCGLMGFSHRADLRGAHTPQVKEIGAGNFGIVRLERNKATGELVAIKYIERGERVTSAVGREIVCHRLLRHPHIVLFREVCTRDQCC